MTACVVRRTYVGVAYGEFDPSSPTFTLLLPVSVSVSLLGAGSTAVGFEAMGRNEGTEERVDRRMWHDMSTYVHTSVSLGSRYGIVALLLHTARAAALIFWIALLGCAVKGGAWWAMLLGVVIFGYMVHEAASRREIESVCLALVLSAVHLGLLGGMVALFFGDEQAEGWAGAVMPLVGMLSCFGGCLFAGCKTFPETSPEDIMNNIRPLTLCCALCCAPLVIAGMGYAFVTAEHVDNNYANKSMPVGGPGSGSGLDDMQYFDCRERTSGLYPAYLATALCVMLTPLYLALDPEYGLERFRNKKWPEKNKEAEAKMWAKVIREDADVPLEEQVEALWMWAEGTADEDGKRYFSLEECGEVAGTAEMEIGALCELLGAKALSEGSAVRHNGQRGTAATGPVRGMGADLDPSRHDDKIRIRWEDNGAVSNFWIRVVELDVEVSVRREDFVATCTQHPERTAKMHAGLLYFTVPHLKEKADVAVLDAKIAAVWRWADAVDDGELGPTEVERLADRAGKYDVLVALGLSEPIRGPRAVLGRRVGTVIDVGTGTGEKTKGKIQVRWEDDGTESPRLHEDDAIMVSDLHEPLGEGSAVRHNGRRGTTATEPDKDGNLHSANVDSNIKIRWEDDETVSGWIKVDELDFDIPDGFSLGEKDFAKICHVEELDRLERKPVEEWFEKLQLALVEEHSCVDALCGN